MQCLVLTLGNRACLAMSDGQTVSHAAAVLPRVAPGQTRGLAGGGAAGIKAAHRAPAPMTTGRRGAETTGHRPCEIPARGRDDVAQIKTPGASRAMTRLPRPGGSATGCAVTPEIVLSLMGLHDALPARPSGASKTARTEET